MKTIKKVLLLACITLLSFTGQSYAQSALTPATDTLTNTDTSRLVIKVPGSNNVLTFQLNYTKISGTPATTVLLQSSLDGINYVTVKGADTATITNVAPTQSFMWQLSRSNFLWYRLYAVTTGTQSGQLKALALFRP